MVTIIQRGIPKSERQYKARCRCGTVFEFKYHEAENVSDQRDGDFLKIHCPLDGCDEMVFVNPKSATIIGCDIDPY